MKFDTEQQQVLKMFSELEKSLIKRSKKRFSLIQWNRRIKGLYIWGGVGRGKTYLMNLFFNRLEMERKARMHFQRFMKDIHDRLFRLSGHQNPLKEIAAELSQAFDIICLDEFHVDDIGDAMLVGNLLHSLHKKGIVLVMTSNLHPDQLYSKGVNRSYFMPCIKAIKQHHYVVCLEGDQDYRIISNETIPVFFIGPKKKTDSKLFKFYQTETGSVEANPGVMEINGRNFSFKAKAIDLIWFSFEELCEKPRSSKDYIYLAQRFNTVMISDVPQLSQGKEERGESGFDRNRTRRFVSLIDELYDQSIRLIASFECELDRLYLGKQFEFLFGRTLSRLTEMQTSGYLKRKPA